MNSFSTNKFVCSFFVIILALLYTSVSHAQWPQSLGGERNDGVNLVRNAANGDVIVSGYFSGSLDTTTGQVTTNGLEDAFIARYGSGGQLKWIQTVGSSGVDRIHDIALGDGNIYVIGEFANSLRVGSNTLNSAGGLDGFVAKLNANGDWKWARRMGGGGQDTARSLVFVPGDVQVVPSVPDSLILGGSYHCSMGFQGPGGQNLTSVQTCYQQSQDMYLARIATDGQWQWSMDRGAQSSGNEGIEKLVRDEQGRIYIQAKQSGSGGTVTLFDEDFDALNNAAWDYNHVNIQPKSGADTAYGTRVDYNLVEREVYGFSFAKYSEASATSTYAHVFNYDFWHFNSNLLTLHAFNSAANVENKSSLAAGGSEYITLEIKVQRGFDQNLAPDGFDIIPRFTTPAVCITQSIGLCLIKERVTIHQYVRGIQEKGQVSDFPEWNENMLIEYLGSDGAWHLLDTYYGGYGYPGGEVFDRTGSSAYTITDPLALHDGLKFRLRNTGSDQCGTDAGGDRVCYDTWHVDDFKATKHNKQVNAVYTLNNPESNTPSFSAASVMPQGLDVHSMAISDDHQKLYLAGVRVGAATSYCQMPNESGGFVLALDVSGVDIGSCVQAKGMPGGIIRDMTVGNNGQVYFTGSFSGAVTFYGDGTVGGDGTLVSTKNGSGSFSTDVLIGSLSADLNWTNGWVTGGGVVDEADGIPAYAGGVGHDFGMSINARNNVLYVGGVFEGIGRFGMVDDVTARSDADAFLANLGTDGRFFQEEKWPVGVPLTPPPGAKVDDLAFVPEFKLDGKAFDAIGSKAFLWTPPIGSGNAQLIPLQPVGRVEIYWRVQGQPLESAERTAPSIGVAAWPNKACSDTQDSNCYQVHVAGTPVRVEPEEGNYKVLSLVNPSSNSSQALYNSGLFNAVQGGISVLVYVNGSTLDQTRYPTVVEVVRTLQYDQVPMFVDNVAAEIGKPIQDAYHNEPNLTGYVIQENAYYDGTGSNAAYQRNARTGRIIPVNRYSDTRPQEEGRELAVAWFHRKKKGVYWPEKAVRYIPHWPYDPEKIIIASQQGSEVLGQAALSAAAYPQAQIYQQNDFSKPGYNPNDEHAFMAPSNTGSGVSAVFALRSDFGQAIVNDSAAASDPYTLVKYFDAANNQWLFRVFKVEATGSGFQSFRFSGVAGTTISPPYPLRLLPGCSESYAEGQASNGPPPPPFFQDYKNQLWSKSAGSGAIFYYYPPQAGFFTDLDNNDVNDIQGESCQPWLTRLPENEGGSSSLQEPIKVSYDISWPERVPQLVSGETLLTPKNGLPDIMNQAAVKVIYDQKKETTPNPLPTDTLVNLIAPLADRSVYLDNIPEKIAKQVNADGTYSITGSSDGTIRLPVSVGKRIIWNSSAKKLMLSGIFDSSGAGEPMLLTNVLSLRDRQVLKKLDGGDGKEDEGFTGECGQSSKCSWDQAVEALFRQSRNPQNIKNICEQTGTEERRQTCLPGRTRSVSASDVLVGYQDINNDGILEPLNNTEGSSALTAGLSQGNGYVTVAFNNDASLNPLPVSLEVIRVGCIESPPPPQTATLITPYQGQINVLAPEDVFDEQLVLRHSGDFAGNPDAMEFEWYFRPDTDGKPPAQLPNPESGQLNGWIKMPVESQQGAIEINIVGANIQTLSDNWYVSRYRGLNACGNKTNWSTWAGQPGGTPTKPRAQLAQGWVKRVLSRLNPFEARVSNFHASETNTYASMLTQLGERYSGPIALNNDPDNLNSIGLIAAYTTVMRRAMQLSVGSTPAVDYGPANNAILLVASRLVDFYALLGNEAYADAQDPTIGITTNTGSFTLNPSIYNFQNQLDSLLSEELVLLRGRDDSGGPVAAAPVYNRLFWNFTTGNGEVAYALSYNITDQDADGFINEKDARILFPQGHGDAWGHYLTGTKTYYDLLRHPFYSWVPRAEAVTVAGAPIQVDFEDERLFATVAAAKARTGAEIVDLTYRSSYVRDPNGQYQGYEDTDKDRAWGMSEWGRRAGMGAYFDWVTVNAILPVEDNDPNHTAIERIDRKSVEKLDQIAASFSAIQSQMDKADAGLNPLGLANNVVPFDIDTTQLDRYNKTQFEQVYDRAMKALKNANQIWLFANQLNNQVRRTQDNADNMFSAGREEELSYANDLIEIFGYPYEDDIGGSGTYPDGYDGPDMYHYMYIDAPQLAGTSFDFDNPIGSSNDLGINKINTFDAEYKPASNGLNFFDFSPLDYDNKTCLSSPQRDGCPLGDLDTNAALKVQYTTIDSPDIGFWFTKPKEWTGSRRAPGELQMILHQMLQARISLKQALLDYEKLRQEITAQAETLQATFDVSEENINIAISQRQQLKNLTIAKETMSAASIALRRLSLGIDTSFKAAKECVPSNTVIGLASGGDLTSMIRCGVTSVSKPIVFGLDTAADAVDIATNATDAAKEDVGELSGIRTSINDSNLELYNIKGELDALMREEPVLRAEIFARAEAAKELVGNYQATLARGLRVYQDLLIFRQEGAAATQQYRYQDMAFRIFRNDALQKYRNSFNLAARYVYLAAAAYDYETNLLGTDSQAGQKFLTSVVKERSIGQVINGEPVSGSSGLANVMAQMKLNFDVLKGQMGFNNPQVETNRFSLRKELFRIPDGEEGDKLWAEKLESMKVADLWKVPEFRRYARPFAPESAGPQPGLVIEFDTNITFGLNFFGWKLGPLDSSYDSSQFATRIRSVGAWFSNYNKLPLADDPRIYIMPVGEDVMRAPSANDFSVRQWQVVDQAVPTPFPIGASDLDKEGWSPMKDSLSGSLVDIRRYGRIRAYHFSEPFDDSQVTSDSRLVGRSVWNRRWMIIIPGGTFLNDPQEGMETFINGQKIPGDSSGKRDGKGVDDIRILFKTYAYTGK